MDEENKVYVRTIHSLTDWKSDIKGEEIVCSPFTGIKVGEEVTGATRETITKNLSAVYAVELTTSDSVTYSWRKVENKSITFTKKPTKSLVDEEDVFSCASHCLAKLGSLEVPSPTVESQNPWVLEVGEDVAVFAFFNRLLLQWDVVSCSLTVPMVHCGDAQYPLYSSNSASEADLLSVMEKAFRVWWLHAHEKLVPSVQSVLLALSGCWEEVLRLDDRDHSAISSAMGKHLQSAPPETFSAVVPLSQQGMEKTRESCANVTSSQNSPENDAVGRVVSIPGSDCSNVMNLVLAAADDHQEVSTDELCTGSTKAFSILSGFRSPVAQSYTAALLVTDRGGEGAEEEDEEEYDDTMHLVLTTGTGGSAPAVVRFAVPAREVHHPEHDLVNGTGETFTYALEVYEVDAELYEGFDDPRIFWTPEFVVTKAKVVGDGVAVSALSFTVQNEKVYMLVPVCSCAAIMHVNVAAPLALELALIPDPEEEEEEEDEY